MVKVSVIIPAFNAESFITEAIESALKQTFRDFEIIVVDDGSTDNTARAVRKFGKKVRFYHQKNQGVSAARNFGVTKANGKYIAFLDQDDRWMPKKLEKQVALIETSPRIGLAFSDFFIMNAQGKIIKRANPVEPKKEICLQLLHRNPIGLGTVLVKKILVKQANGFDKKYFYAQDLDLWLKLVQITEFGYIDAPLAMYRIHENCATKMAGALAIIEPMKIWKKYLKTFKNDGSKQRAIREGLAKSYLRLIFFYLEQRKCLSALLQVPDLLKNLGLWGRASASAKFSSLIRRKDA